HDQVTGGEGFRIGVYDLTNGEATASLVAEKLCAMPLGPIAWHEFMLDTPVVLTPGNVYVISLTRTTGGNYYVSRIAAGTGFSRVMASAVNGALNNPLGATTSNHNYNYAIEAVTAPSLPAIVVEGTDLTAYPGQSRTAKLEYLIATPTAIAYVYAPEVGDPIVSTHTDFVWDDDEETIAYTVVQGQLPYGSAGLSTRVSFDSGDPITLGGIGL